MNKTEKEELVEEFKTIFQNAVTGILVDFKGSSVEVLTNLRKKLFEKKARFRVVKNTLAKIASEGTPFEPIKEDFIHSRALVYSNEDPVGAAKIIYDASEDSKSLKLISGILVTDQQGRKLDFNEIKALGNLPSREELLVQILFLMNAPVTNLVRVLNEVPAKFVRTLQAIADSKQ